MKISFVKMSQDTSDRAQTRQELLPSLEASASPLAASRPSWDLPSLELILHGAGQPWETVPDIFNQKLLPFTPNGKLGHAESRRGGPSRVSIRVHTPAIAPKKTDWDLCLWNNLEQHWPVTKKGPKTLCIRLLPKWSAVSNPSQVKNEGSALASAASPFRTRWPSSAGDKTFPG